MVKKSQIKDENKRVLDQRPFFFKTFHEMIEKRLKIPPQFVRDVLKEMPTRVILECPSGSPWRAKVVKTAEGQVFLGDGWEKFVEDNRLQQHEFLLFGYDQRATQFTVQIFGKNGLERHYSSSSAPKPHQEIANSSGIQTSRHVHSRGGRVQSRKDCAVIQDQVKPFHSHHPFFEAIIKSYNVERPFVMIIPKSFADDHSQRAKTKIRLNFFKRNKQR